MTTTPHAREERDHDDWEHREAGEQERHRVHLLLHGVVHRVGGARLHHGEPEQLRDEAPGDKGKRPRIQKI